MRYFFLLLAACGGNHDSLGTYAVGTYIGGGSMFGSDDCTYEGSPSVFQDDKPSATPAPGPRFITGAGNITVHCKKGDLKATAVVPTGAKIAGPAKVAKGARSEYFSASLVAGEELSGQPSIDWTLGHDCQGIATFDTPMGAQDTGGRDRGRYLLTTGPGKCTVIATLTTGSETLYPAFKGKAFQAETLVTIQ